MQSAETLNCLNPEKIDPIPETKTGAIPENDFLTCTLANDYIYLSLGQNFLLVNLRTLLL